MIIQAYYAPEFGRATMWDNATQVQSTDISWAEYMSKNFDGFEWHDWAVSQEQEFNTGQSEVTYIWWVDRGDSKPHALISMFPVFILNDDGKTIKRA